LVYDYLAQGTGLPRGRTYAQGRAQAYCRPKSMPSIRCDVAVSLSAAANCDVRCGEALEATRIRCAHIIDDRRIGFRSV
jgi:hypothetical protein